VAVREGSSAAGRDWIPDDSGMTTLSALCRVVT
jgi:hypothetical protein